MKEVAGYRMKEEIWIDASPERVFRAWTTPEELVKWWRIPGAYDTTEAEVDLRVGGRYRLAGTSARLGQFEVQGEYRVVEPGRRLVYTWSPDWDEDARGSVVELTFEAREGGTRLSVEHTGFMTTASRDDHRSGWPQVAGRVKAHVEG